MTTFLLLISLLLNGVAIFSIIILFTRQNRLVEVEKRQGKMMKDVEEIISSSLFEMKEENDAFIQRVQQVFKQTSPDRKGLKSKREVIQKIDKRDISPSLENDEELLGLGWADKTGNMLKKQAVKAYKNTSINQEMKISPVEEDNILSELNYETDKQPPPESLQTSTEYSDGNSQMTQEQSDRDLLINQVRILQKQGFSNEETAKMLGKGKTEIELLLKFDQNDQ